MKVKTNITNANWVLTQTMVDRAIENKNTINLSNRLHISEIKRNRVKRNVRNNELPILKSILSFVLMFIMLVGILINRSPVEANNQDHDTFLRHFPLETRVIGCYNKYTKETREDSICTKPWDLNIKLPARWQIVIWLKYYSEHQILNRLALVNFESSFNIHASNPVAKWYIQTLRSYNIPIDIDTQLQWLKNREQKTYAKVSYAGKYGKIRGCAYYWNNTNFKDWFAQWEYGVLSCMYRYHYQANTGTWYWKRWVKATKFYKKYMFWIDY